MLLLLANNLLVNNLFDLPKGDQNYRLRDLFEINIGLIEDKFNKMTTESKEEVMFINLKASKDDNSQVSNLTINDYHTRNLIDYNELERKNLPIINDSTKQGVPEDRVLTSSDYLISIRGRPKGFSLSKSLDTNKRKLVASHHFIQIRPMALISHMHVPYLHLLIDIILEMEVLEKFEEIKKEEEIKGKNYSVFNSFKVNDFRDIKINITTDVKLQQDTYDKFINQYNIFLNANLEFEKMKESLYINIKK